MAWLHKNGRAYKSETIEVQAADGRNVTGRLNWQKAQHYNWNGRNYIDIPYEFSSGVIVSGAGGYADGGFNLVLRKMDADVFEGAIRAITYNVNATNIITDSIVNFNVEQNVLLDGSKANIWHTNADYKNPRKAISKNYSVLEIAALKKQAEVKKPISSTIPRLVETVTECTPYSYAYYVPGGPCTYNPTPDIPCVQNGHYETGYAISCTTTYYDNGSTGSGGGGGYPPAQPPVNQPPVVVNQKDPCVEAANKAAVVKNAFDQKAVTDKIQEAGDLTQLSKEKGFATYEKIEVNPYDITDVKRTPYSSALFEGTETNVTVPLAIDNLNALVSVSHFHPNGGYTAPSPPDVYGVIKASGVNVGNFSNNSFVGNFVKAADGSVYALIITDADLAGSFLGTEGANVENREWKAGTDISNSFNFAVDHYKKKYRRDKDKTNLVFENAMAAVMNEFNTGVTLMKQDKITGEFKAVIRRKQISTKSNGKTITTYNNPC